MASRHRRPSPPSAMKADAVRRPRGERQEAIERVRIAGDYEVETPAEQSQPGARQLGGGAHRAAADEARVVNHDPFDAVDEPYERGRGRAAKPRDSHARMVF